MSVRISPRSSDASPAWHSSPYLLSVGCVLLGCYLLVHGAEGLPSLRDLRTVLATQIGYSACLLAVGGWLIRRGDNRRDGLLLLALLLLFTLDAHAIQHLYGWTSADGRHAAWAGVVSGAFLLAGAALVLGHAPWSRLALTGVAAAAFVRFDGFVVAHAPPPDPDLAFSPEHVVLSWLLAACALPVIVLASPRDDAPSARIEEGVGLLACLAFPTAHLAVIGFSLALPTRVAYFAPLLIVLPAFVERLWSEVRSARWRRILLDLAPLVGIMATATFFAPSLVDAPWARRLPLTPFLLAMIGATLVTGLRAWRLRHAGMAHAAAGLAALTLLGGELPETLARLRFPSAWQAILVASTCWLTMAIARRFEAGLWLHGLASFVAASWLSESFAIPWTAGFVALLALGLLAHARSCDVALPLRERIASVAAVIAASLVPLALDHGAVPRLAFVLVACLLLLALGLLSRDRVVSAGAPALLLGTGLIELVGVQAAGEVSAGRLLIELGFVLLLVGALRSMMGSRLRGAVRSWWARTQE